MGFSEFMNQFNDIKPPIPLKSFVIKGNFTINCCSLKDYLIVRNFFPVKKDFIYFKDIAKLSEKFSPNLVFDIGDRKSKLKFVIKYESMGELLKLRDIFKIRANKFDTRLIEKRKMVNIFGPDFYKEFDNLNIEKIRR